MTAYRYTFTVFTAAYNSTRTLHRVYDSLGRQTFRDFEWLIVDDGSTDGTGDLIRQWQGVADFPIRYIRQENAGKHYAFNRAVSEAQGRLFLVLDHDDACEPQALARFNFHWETIPADQKETFSAVTCLSRYPDGRLVGSRFPLDPTDSNSLEIRHKYNVKGEKWGFHRTDVLKQFPYPQIEHEWFIPDSLVWNRIARVYKTRYVNEVLRVYYRAPDTLGARHIEARSKNARGARLYYKEFVSFGTPIPRKYVLRNYANYVRFSCHARVGIVRQIKDIPSLLYWLAAFPVGLFKYLSDRLHIWRRQDES